MAVPAAFVVSGPREEAESRAWEPWPVAFLAAGVLRLARWETLPGAGLLSGIPLDPVSPVWDEETLLSLAGNRNYWGKRGGIRRLSLKQAHNYNDRRKSVQRIS